MRREVAVLALAGLGLSLGSCAKEEPVPPPQCPEGQVCMVPPRSLGDEIAGCDVDERATLVRVKIELKVDHSTGTCIGSVKPKRVCVMQGGVIHWKVKNHCDIEDDPDGVLKITGDDIDWLLCDPRLTTLDKEADDPDKTARPSKKNQLLCGVPDDTAIRDYQYLVEGSGIEFDDPWIEVRRGG